LITQPRNRETKKGGEQTATRGKIYNWGRNKKEREQKKRRFWDWKTGKRTKRERPASRKGRGGKKGEK